jgi:hypothetical protein
METAFVAAIEEVMGRKVRFFLSRVTFDPDISVESSSSNATTEKPPPKESRRRPPALHAGSTQATADRGRCTAWSTVTGVRR